jgi:hypothetical protein
LKFCKNHFEGILRRSIDKQPSLGRFLANDMQLVQLGANITDFMEHILYTLTDTNLQPANKDAFGRFMPALKSPQDPLLVMPKTERLWHKPYRCTVQTTICSRRHGAFISKHHLLDDRVQTNAKYAAGIHSHERVDKWTPGDSRRHRRRRSSIWDTWNYSHSVEA